MILYKFVALKRFIVFSCTGVGVGGVIILVCVFLPIGLLQWNIGWGGGGISSRMFFSALRIAVKFQGEIISSSLLS